MIDLANKTEQEIINIICEGFAQQDWRRAVFGGHSTVMLDGREFHPSSCLYRAQNGDKCAAGQVIEDAEYKPAMEGMGWPGLVNVGYATDAHYGLMNDMQECHDTAEDSRTMRRRLVSEIRVRHLVIPTVLVEAYENDQ